MNQDNTDEPTQGKFSVNKERQATSSSSRPPDEWTLNWRNSRRSSLSALGSKPVLEKIDQQTGSPLQSRSLCYKKLAQCFKKLQ